MDFWTGDVILSEFCQLGSYFLPGTNIVKKESAIHYQIRTEDGLIVDFCRVYHHTYQVPGFEPKNIIPHPFPMESIYCIGEKIIVSGKVIQETQSIILLECTGISDSTAQQQIKIAAEESF